MSMDGIENGVAADDEDVGEMTVLITEMDAHFHIQWAAADGATEYRLEVLEAGVWRFVASVKECGTPTYSYVAVVRWELPIEIKIWAVSENGQCLPVKILGAYLECNAHVMDEEVDDVEDAPRMDANERESGRRM